MLSRPPVIKTAGTGAGQDQANLVPHRSFLIYLCGGRGPDLITSNRLTIGAQVGHPFVVLALRPGVKPQPVDLLLRQSDERVNTVLDQGKRHTGSKPAVDRSDVAIHLDPLYGVARPLGAAQSPFRDGRSEYGRTGRTRESNK